MKLNFKTPAILAAAVVLSRLPFVSKMLYNMDSAQFALATDKFDVALHLPQPPGYFLYVMMGKLLVPVTGDANSALVTVSIIFSALAVVVVYMLASELFDKGTGTAASMVAATSPVFWLHGEVALSYAPEAFMSALFAYFCLRMIRGGRFMWLAAAVALAVAGGIRQNTMVFLFPLWVFSMRRLDAGKVVSSMVVFAVTLAAWFLPMLHITGGYGRYSEALRAHWLDANWRGIHLNWIAFNGRYMALFLLGGLGAAFAPLAAGMYFRARGILTRADLDTVLFFVFWLVPPIMFHLIIFTHPAVPGHSLIYMVGLFILAGRALTAIPDAIAGASLPKANKIKVYAVSLISGVNAFIFILMPMEFSANTISEHDRLVLRYVDAVRKNFSPSDTEIIGSNRFFLSYRHAMYYLPEYRVHDTTVLSAPCGPHVLWGFRRETRMAGGLDFLPGTKRYIDFTNYNKSETPGLTTGAEYLSLPEDSILVYYKSIDGLRRVGRIAPLLGKDKAFRCQGRKGPSGA